MTARQGLVALALATKPEEMHTWTYVGPDAHLQPVQVLGAGVTATWLWQGHVGEWVKVPADIVAATLALLTNHYSDWRINE